MDDDGRDLRVSEHVLEAINRVSGIKRQIRRTRPQDAENADHQLRRADTAKSHQRTARHARHAQATANAVRLRQGLGVRHRGPTVRQRDVVRRPRCLPRKPTPQRVRRREVTHRPTPKRKHRGPRRSIEQRQGRDRLFGLRQSRSEQHLVSVGEPGDRLRFEKIRAVLPPRCPAAGGLLQRQGEVYLRRSRIDLDHLRLQTREVERTAGRVLYGEVDLEERRAAAVPGGLHCVDHLIEGSLLATKGLDALRLHPTHQRGKGQRTLETHAEHQRVDQETDQRLRLGPEASRHRCSDEQFGLTRPTRQQQRIRAEEHHEGRRSRLTADRAERSQHGCG